ncbi:DNA polymerase domain-containing protein [Dactylosporangium matsuzakiense]|uniref:DNA polymerase domain-containing protein n=1 Tax=Dactylosporangium matsuzakiense TaxID=53360 RepID=UPI0021C293A0|nr:DNA polymerase ligase N-terminal domain-containing protein [Dactylosporangium matsuzakiense]UWZ41867.1 ATP-dependent DNA ligase [Dactylosporangium matsuzakiense]
MSSLRFVVQLHRARRLHYDFRLEVDGVLVSWAVPKGPTLDPKVRRAAFHVDDHPMEYVAFEGVIPAGTYGGGDVIVWDSGHWVPYKDSDPKAAIAGGELHIELHGEKLRGKFVMVRTRADEWLLLKKRDEFAADGWEASAFPLSVLSGRSSDEVKADPEWFWRSDLPAARAAVPARPGMREIDLAGLNAIRENGTWEVFGRSLRVTNLSKVLFPARDGEDPVTKRELLRYTAETAFVVQPYLAGRALNLHRFPGGAATKGFWQKALPSHAPDWLPRWTEPGSGTEYLVVNEPAALVWAANFGGLEWHPWTSTVDAPDRPSYALIDLDPGGGTAWADLLVLARLHRTAFEHLGVRAWAKVTGRRGIQVWVPVERGPGFAETRAWVERLSRSVGAVVPELVSWAWEKAERGGRARLDFTQNAVNKTLVAPYSPRPAPGAPVSAPIAWDELDDPALRPDGFTIRTIGSRLAERGDLFSGVLHTAQRLPPL